MKHSSCSPSASVKWMNCPASRLIEPQYKEDKSEVAERGIELHNAFEKHIKKGTECPDDLYQLSDYVKKYDTQLEVKVDFGFGHGTADAIIKRKETIEIIDLKTGFNPVYAKENSQLMLYASAFLNQYKKYILTIFQPMRGGFDSWVINNARLKTFWLKAYKQTKRRNFLAGSWCRYCKHLIRCKTMANKMQSFNFDVALSDDKALELLKNKKAIIQYIDKTEENILDRLQEGEVIKGFKISMSKGRRKWTDEGKKILEEELGEKAFKKSLISITEAKKMIDTRKLTELGGQKEVLDFE